MNISTCEQCVNGRSHFFSLQFNRLFWQSALISSMNMFVFWSLNHTFIYSIHICSQTFLFFLMLNCCTTDAGCRLLLFFSFFLFFCLVFCFSLRVQSQLHITTHYSSFVFLLSFFFCLKDHIHHVRNEKKNKIERIILNL